LNDITTLPEISKHKPKANTKSIAKKLMKIKLSPMELKRYVESIRDEACSDSARSLKNANQSEKILMQAYEGRVLFELIQNVRDANKEAGIMGSVYITLDTKTLIVANTGAPFSKRGINSITTIGDSSKDSMEFIGFKGIGFKSVQEVSDTPQIVTGSGSIYFDRRCSLPRLNGKITKLKDIPLFFIPHYLPECLSKEELQNGIVTRIIMPLNRPATKAEIQKSFDEIGVHQLLLLGNLKELNYTSGKYQFFFKIDEILSTGRVTLETPDGQYQFKRFKPKYKVKIPTDIIETLPEKEQDIYRTNPYADISLLFDLDTHGKLKLNPGANLYLFYPLDTISGFPFIIHSYFVVNPERKGLRDSPLNTFLLESIGDYLTGEWLKLALDLHRSTFVDYLAFMRSGPKIMNALYDRVVLNLQDKVFIYDANTGNTFKPSQVIIADGEDKGLFENHMLKNKHLVYLKNPNTIKWLRDEIGVEYLYYETIRQYLEEECARQKRKNNLGFFKNLYQYLVENDDLNVRGLKVLLTSNWKLLTDTDEVYYGMTQQQKVVLPKAIQKKIHFIHPAIVISDKRLGKAQTGFIEYNAELLVRRLVNLFEDPQVPNIDIFKTLVELRVSDRLYPYIKERVMMLTKTGKWVKPLTHPVYIPSVQLEDLYGTGSFLNVSEIFGTDEISAEQRAKMIGFGAWTLPAAYYSEHKLRITATDKRFKILHSIDRYTTSYFEVFGDWMLDIPENPNEWFTNAVIFNWKKYEQLIKGDYAKAPVYKSHQSDKHDIPAHLLVQITSLGHGLRTKKWISLENDAQSYSCSEVVGMDPGEYNQGSNLILRRHLKTLKIHYTSNSDFIVALDMMHYDRESIDNWKNILQFVKTSYPTISDDSKEFVSFYNKLLSKLFDFYEWSLPANDKTPIRQLSSINFLGQDEQTGILEWKPASKIFYLDDKTSYDLLPARVKEMVQPHFTNRDRNRFGQIGRVIGISFKSAVKQELRNEPVLKESTLFDFFPVLPECLALTEFLFRVNLDRDLEKIKQTLVLEKKEVVVDLYRNNVLVDILYLPHKVENGKIPELHIVPKNAVTGPTYYANALHDLLVELLERDFINLHNFLLDFLARQDKDKFLRTYDIDQDRVNDIREKLSDHVYTNEQSFWYAVLQAVGIANPEGYFEEDGVYYDDLDALFKTGERQVFTLAARIDFNRLQEIKNLPHLQAMFRLLNVDPSEFNKHAVAGLDFSEYFNRLFKGLKSKFKPQLQEKLYHYLLSKKPEKQSEFQDLMDTYRDQLIYNGRKGDIFVDFEQVLLAGLKKLFAYLNIKSLDINEEDETDFPMLYHQNLMKIKEAMGIEKIAINQLDFFLALNKNRSLVYFAQDELLIFKYKNYLNSIAKPIGPVDGLSDDPLAAYFNPVGTKIEKTPTHHAGKANFFGSGSSGTGGKGSGKRTDGGAYNDHKELIGLVAEKMVYEQLIREKFHNVTWVSKNAARAKVNPEGTDDEGYDIGYIDDVGNNHFIEVKGKSDNVKHFYISGSEFAKALEEQEYYHVIFVPYVLNNDEREMHDLGNIFMFRELEDLFNNNRFTAKFNILEVSFT